MLRNLNALTGYKLQATDGELGAVDEFYFDDVSWKVRYMVVRTGGWLAGRKVLISPVALGSPNWKNETFPANLTMEQVRNSPDIDTEKTVTRQHELDLHGHYAWPLYWGDAFYGGSMSGSPLLMESEPQPFRGGDSHLQGTRAVTGYGLHAADGHVGHVRDYIVDDGWNIRYLVVDTGIWLPGRKVLISPHWIESVNWDTAEVFVDLTREAIKRSPEYDPDHAVSEDYESELYDHYGRPKLSGEPGRQPAGGKR